MTKEKLLKTAIIPGAIALVAALLSFRIPFDGDVLAGFISVLMLAGIFAIEYRLSWKQLIGR